MPLNAGMRLGAYEILAPLEAGGMGEVYRARDPRLDRDVAIKVLPEGWARDPERLARFEREAAVAAACQIAEALDAAHGKGVVHRVPANVKVTPEGKVKVLDFGLAKASPTMSVAATRAGVILRFLMIRQSEAEDPPAQLHLVTNWFEELKGRK